MNEIALFSKTNKMIIKLRMNGLSFRFLNLKPLMSIMHMLLGHSEGFSLEEFETGRLFSLP